MIIIDEALRKLNAQEKSIKVALVGAGFMARGIALQICKFVPGMELAAIANRTVSKAKLAFEEADVFDLKQVDNVADLENCIRQGRPAVTDNPALLCEAGGIDAIIEATGAVEYGAHVVMNAIKNGKHVILMNSELDGTIGPILKKHADSAGVVYTNADGDQPGVIMNLYRFVKQLGVRPVLCGNIKGLHDPYRNPTTQLEFAKKWGQNPSMVTSFADGSKISFEQTVVANATGMKVGKRGMFGPAVSPGTPVTKSVDLYPLDMLLDGPGLIDYVVGAEPSPGVFVLGTHDHPIQKHYLNLYKLGEGPLYCFYTPYHLCHFEVPNTVARAVLFGDAALKPLGKPVVEVVAAAKIELHPGDVIDPIGHYKTYGLCENSETCRSENLLPIGLAEGCTMKRHVPKDQVLTFDDVSLPPNRLADKLWNEQLEYFSIKMCSRL